LFFKFFLQILESKFTVTKFFGAQPELMQNYKTNSIINVFVIVPMLASSLTMNAFTANIKDAIAAKEQIEIIATLTPEEKALQKEREEIAAKIDAYFGKHTLPLTGYGMTFVLAGEKYAVDPLLLASIAMRESTGGKHIPKGSFNAFGWGSAKFQSFEHAINMVAMNLGGHNERTAHYYKGKTIPNILRTYNSVIPTYVPEVVGIMKKIDTMPV